MSTIEATGVEASAEAAPAADLQRARLRFADALWLGTVGLRARRLRTLLTSLGVAIGISAMVAVVGISASSRADLLAELDRLGTNLLQVARGATRAARRPRCPRRRRR